MSHWRTVLATAAAVDRSKIDLGFAVRCAAGVAIPLLAGELAGDPAYGVAAAAGALNTGFASMQGVYRTRAASMLMTALGMGLLSFVGSVAERSLIGIVLVTALAGYLYGIVASLGPSASSVALNSIVSLVVFGRLGLALPAAALQALLIFGGGVFQTVLLVGIWPFRRYVAERTALAGAYRALAATARSLAAGDIALPSAASIVSVHATLGDPQPFARRGDIAVFQALLDEAERIRASLGALATDRQRFQTIGARRADTLVRSALDTCSAPLDDLAAALLEGRAPRAHADEWLRIEEYERELGDVSSALGPSVVHELRAVFGQLRSAWRIASVPGRGTGDDGSAADAHAPVRVSFPSIAETFARMRANVSLDSPYGRHALRVAITLGIAALIGHVIASDRGYWITLTAALVLRPDYTTTFSRGVARFGGTILGALLAAGIALWLHPSVHLDALLTIVFASLAYVAFNANYGLFSLAVTGYVVFLLAIVGQPDVQAVHDRLIATTAGGALATLAMLVWPTWEGEQVRERLAAMLEAQRTFAALVLDAFANPQARDLAAIHDAQVATWAARIAAETSVDRAIAEPGRGRTLPSEAMLGILAASRRVGLEMLALDGALAHLPDAPHPRVARFRDAFLAVFDDAVARLRGTAASKDGEKGRHYGLRDTYRELYENGSDLDEAEALVRAAGDELVDGIDTLHEIASALA